MNMPLRCLCCGSSYTYSQEVMNALSYVKYSYCDNCVRNAIDMYKASCYANPAEKPARTLWYICGNLGLSQAQVDREGRVYVWASETAASTFFYSLKQSMERNGFANWTHTLSVASFEDKTGQFIDGRDYVFYKGDDKK